MKGGTRIIGLAGWHNAGKTTVLAGVIPVLVRRGITVSTIKRAHHGFDIDQPGKDSHTHRIAGAHEVLVSSARRFALVHELRGAPELELGELLCRLEPVDIVVVEGFKSNPHPKIEVHRESAGGAFLFPGDRSVRAFVSDRAGIETVLPCAALDDFERIADLMIELAAPFGGVS